MLDRLRALVGPSTVPGKIAANATWLFAEKGVRLTLGLVVGALLARHLGPADFGILSYGLSLVGFASAFVYLGLSGVVVKDLVASPDRQSAILGSTFCLKQAGAVLSFLALAAVAVHAGGTPTETTVLLLLAASLLVQPFSTIDLWFQSRTESRSAIMPRTLAFALAAAAKLTAIALDGTLVVFAAINLAEAVLAAVLLALSFHRSGQRLTLLRPSLAGMKDLLGRSWILVLSRFLSLVYLQVDQVMLRFMRGAEDVGVYSVAATFSEVWYFIPTVVAASMMPTLVGLHASDPPAFRRFLQRGFDLLTLTALAAAILMQFGAAPLIGLVFGPAYAAAGPILAIHVWAGVFFFMEPLFSKWYIIENRLSLSLYAHGCGALVNVALNFVLIGPLGGIGAAIATLISYACAAYLCVLVLPGTREIGAMMSKALVAPLRYLLGTQNRRT